MGNEKTKHTPECGDRPGDALCGGCAPEAIRAAWLAGCRWGEREQFIPGDDAFGACDCGDELACPSCSVRAIAKAGQS